MEDQSIFTGSQPKGGISENLQRFIDSMVEEIVLEGKPFDTQKKYLKKFSENEGLDYEKLEADITTFIEILDSLKVAFTKVQVKLAEEKGRECHISDATVKKLVNHLSSRWGPKPPNTGPGLDKNKKGLWIALVAIAAVVLFAVLLLRPKPKPVEESLDTQAFNACQTVQDYRRYISDYGRNSEHYADAKRFVDDYVSDSAAKAQQQLAQQQADAEAKAEAEKKEDAAYQKCTTVAACDSYLNTYPKGRYVTEVKSKKVELEQQAKQQQTQQQTSQYTLTGNANGHAYVDLGLPSGTLWATCNVGASKPEDYGNYYAWGETSTKNTYNFSTYKYANGSYYNLTKYCNDVGLGNNGFTDNLTNLELSDDAATANWDNGWHTPDKKQWEELLNYTTNKWTTQNGVQGRLFTAKNGQTLFLPAAGCCSDDELDSVGSDGIYWSSSLATDNSHVAWKFYFTSDGYDMRIKGGRAYGLSVRAVRAARQN